MQPTSFALLASLSLFWIGGGPPDKSEKKPKQTVYEQITEKLKKAKAHAALAELEYWDKLPGVFGGVTHKSVKIKSGEMANLFLVEYNEFGIPAEQFSMVFLLLDDKLVDYRSCRTNNRVAIQKLLLEDVDGDGFVDVAIQYKMGMWGPGDKRQYQWPGDKRIWLNVYQITKDGFKSIFPNEKIKLTKEIDVGKLPIKIEVDGLPNSVEKHKLFWFTVTVWNTGKQPIKIRPAEWFQIEVVNKNDGKTLSYGKLESKLGAFAEDRMIIGPGELIASEVGLFLYGSDEVILRFTFVPVEKK